jgi:Straboviridae DNA ligase
MPTVIDIFESLETTTGKNARLEILEVNRKNKLLKRAFIAAQDPYTVYYVNKFKMPVHIKSSGPDDDTLLTAFLGLLEKLSKRELTGNAAKDAVTEILTGATTLQQKWCQRILLKNLRCGLQESSINKVWPGVVKSFAVALACTLKSEFVKGEGIKILEPVSYPVRVEPKLDGLRCIAVKQNGKVTFFTRNGTILESPGLACVREILTNAPFDNVVLDGEMLANGNWNDSVTAVMKGR